MKKILLILSGIIMITGMMAQVPQGITHQAVMRDSQNQPIGESPIGVRISILQGGVDGEAVYVETHNPISNANGLITYVIGQGAVESGVFAEIDWSSGSYFLKTESDPTGGTDYIISGVTQFHSVPYALFAEESAEKEGTYAGEIKYWDGSAWTAIQPGEHGQTLTLCDDVPTWGPCKYTLILQASPVAGGTVTGAGEYYEGEIVEITAIANHGWTFVYWTDEDGNVVSDEAIKYIEMPASELSLVANFASEQLTLTINIAGEGSVTTNPDQEFYLYGDIVMLEATADEGYTFSHWIGDVADNDSPFTNIVITEDKLVEAVFIQDQYTLSVNIIGEGEVTKDPDQAFYLFGDILELLALAADGWEFVEWTGDTEHLDDAESAEAVVTMPADDITLTAVFQEEDDSDIIYGDGVTDIDGNVYQTVIIGNQEWMAENLRVTKYNNGNAIPTGLNDTEWQNTTSGAYAIYNNSNDMLEAYGKLYNWYAVDDARGLCPEGWSVPSDDDWTALVNYVVSEGFPNEWNNPNGAGNALKSCHQVGSPLEGCNTSEHPRWNSHGTHHGFDEFGFSALPGGYRWSDGSFYDFGSHGFWWSATEFSGTNAWGRSMVSDIGAVGRFNYGKRDGFSVRCLRDISDEQTLYNLNLDIHPEDAGSVSGAGEYQEGYEVIITATANEGWEFVNWTGDTEHLDDADSAEALVTMPADNITLTAVFQEDDDDPVFTCGDNITFTYKGQQVIYGTVSRGGLCWLDRNLGADPMPFVPADHATGNTDTRLYGDLFQWGRLDDGHQARTSSTTPGPVNQDVPGHGNFITVGSSPWDWRSPQNNALWQGEDGTNNPCPPGWRVPTEAELNAERLSWGSNNSAGAYASTLKWPVGGRRDTNGTLYGVGSYGNVWSSSVVGTGNRYLYFGSGNAYMGSGGRAYGMSVRCVRDN